MEFDFKLLLKRIVINDPRKLPSLSNLISCLLYIVCGVLTRSLIVFCSGLQFSDNVLGKALVNTICTFSSSGGVSSDSVLICYAQFQLFVLHYYFLFKIPRRFQMA